MTYFSNYPKTLYEFNGKESVVTDIFRRVVFMSEYKPVTDMYSSYTIRDGDSPLTIAQSVYGSHKFYWVILIFNEIHNPYYDWPLDQLSLETFCREKYGDDMFVTRHFEKDGYVVGSIKEYSTPWVPPANPFSGNASVVPVSFLEYENALNEAKRKINLLRPELLQPFVTQYENALNV